MARAPFTPYFLSILYNALCFFPTPLGQQTVFLFPVPPTVCSTGVRAFSVCFPYLQKNRDVEYVLRSPLFSPSLLSPFFSCYFFFSFFSVPLFLFLFLFFFFFPRFFFFLFFLFFPFFVKSAVPRPYLRWKLGTKVTEGQVGFFSFHHLLMTIRDLQY